VSGGSLAPFLDPASVAVVGASRDPFKVGGSVVANLRSAGFRGYDAQLKESARTRKEP
jgi:acyl-CoA synthetase (NDP forming)